MRKRFKCTTNSDHDQPVAANPEFRFEVSPRLRQECENGKTYCALQGRVILPARASDRPDPDLLR